VLTDDELSMLEAIGTSGSLSRAGPDRSESPANAINYAERYIMRDLLSGKV
jgi:hypothetical protein